MTWQEKAQRKILDDLERKHKVVLQAAEDLKAELVWLGYTSLEVHQALKDIIDYLNKQITMLENK